MKKVLMRIGLALYGVVVIVVGAAVVLLLMDLLDPARGGL